MTRGQARLLRILGCFSLLLLLVIRTEAYPQRNGKATQSRYWRSVEEDEEESQLPTTTSSTRSPQSSDEVRRLIETAYENSELLNASEWPSNYRGSRSGSTRDSSHYPDSYTAQTALKERKVPSSTSGMQSDGKIVFPNDDDVIGKPHKFDSRAVPICHDSTFCERAAYYPEDLVNQAVNLNDSLKFLAGVDVVPDVVQRIDAPDDVPLCVSTEQIVYPKSAENKRKEWLFVVNQDNFKQGIRIETCSNENDDCSVIVDGLSEGYKTTCKQKYIYRQMAAISSDGTIVPDMFRFPSSCCCHVKFIGNPLMRIGVGLNDQRNQTPVPKTGRSK